MTAATVATEAIDVTVSEVGTRDGLQNIDTILPTDAKKAWIAAEAAAGVPEIEVGSFVPPVCCRNWPTPPSWSASPRRCPD